MMRLRSTTLLSLGSQAIDLRSLGMRISHPMTELPLPDVLSPIWSSLLPRGAVRFLGSITTSLFRPYLTARRLPSHLPRLGRSLPPPLQRQRGHMQRQVQECKDVNCVGCVGFSRHGNMRTSSDGDVPHHPRPSSGTMARSIRVGSVWVSYPVRNIS